MKKKQESKKFEFKKTTILKFENMINVNGGTGNNGNCQDIGGRSYLGTNGTVGAQVN